MCGLAGLWGDPGGASVEDLQHSASAMAAALSHRGPDDAGVWSESASGVVLAHQRLAILDLSAAGHQPWRGHSDTETLLAAIQAWGLEGAFQRCGGMFALALWDRQERRLQLARDRFGEKPLDWGWLDRAGQRVLVFASELAAIRACPGASAPAVNPDALAAFFRAGCLPAPLSIYAGLQQLPPGYCLEFSRPQQQSDPQSWWDLQEQAAQAFAQQPLLAATSEADVLEQLERTLHQVIAEQALADVPLGTFLSGGVDSSLITALLQAKSNRPVRSFTIAFPDAGSGEAGFNEAPHTAAVAA